MANEVPFEFLKHNGPWVPVIGFDGAFVWELYFFSF